MCERLEQVWHTRQPFPRLFFIMYFLPQTGRSAKVGVLECDFIFPPPVASVSLTLFFSPAKEGAKTRTADTERGIPSHRACIRPTVSEKWDVKRLSTARVDMMRSYLLDIRIHFVPCDNFTTLPISKPNKEKQGGEEKQSAHKWFDGCFTTCRAAIYLSGWAGVSVELGRNPCEHRVGPM